MSLDLVAMASDLTAILADLPTTFSIGATSYSCAATEAGSDSAPSDAGIWPEADLELLSAYSAAFVVGAKVVYGTKTYRVESVKHSPDGVSSRLFCRALDKPR